MGCRDADRAWDVPTRAQECSVSWNNKTIGIQVGCGRTSSSSATSKKQKQEKTKKLQKKKKLEKKKSFSSKLNQSSSIDIIS
mmetsp:Transcript_51919/g.57961  ORF Transcript_51919/g.57961 Transcript_51919/m.57961 type:complete len:82 (-) Transcript_51919:169-414(-)